MCIVQSNMVFLEYVRDAVGRLGSHHPVNQRRSVTIFFRVHDSLYMLDSLSFDVVRKSSRRVIVQLVDCDENDWVLSRAWVWLIAAWRARMRDGLWSLHSETIDRSIIGFETTRVRCGLWFSWNVLRAAIVTLDFCHRKDWTLFSAGSLWTSSLDTPSWFFRRHCRKLSFPYDPRRMPPISVNRCTSLSRVQNWQKD